MNALFRCALIAIAMSATIPAQASIDSQGYKDSITIQGNEVTISWQARDHLVNTGILTVLNQAASTPAYDEDGDQIGYTLSEIEPGSIYDVVGLQDGDLVTHIDDIRLSNPKISVELLRYVKGEDAFSFAVRRRGEPIRFHVRVQ